MATIKDRFKNWKNTRNTWQKAGDIFFWLLLIFLIIPGPRKVIMTSIKKVSLQFRAPSVMEAEKQIQLTDHDYTWIIKDEQGENVPLDHFRGKVIFLNFWATWCPPCIAELPEIEKLYEKYSQEVAFLLVTADSPATVNKFMEKRKYDLPVYYYVATPPDPFKGNAIPQTYIISPDGRIVTRKVGAVNWDSKSTQKIFKQLIP